MENQTIIDIMKSGNSENKVRVLGFGSSNTEHFLAGMHWMECLEIASTGQYGRVHTFINTGVGGNTTVDLLNRYERDAEFFKPHIVIITVGGNDANTDRNISAEMYRENLNALFKKFDSIGCKVVFQTYYAPIPRTDPEEGILVSKFNKFMEIVRETAKNTGAGLVDHQTRWNILREAAPVKYYELMHDDWHVNHKGNMVMGMDLARYFGADLYERDMKFFKEAKICQMIMDTP